MAGLLQRPRDVEAVIPAAELVSDPTRRAGYARYAADLAVREAWRSAVSEPEPAPELEVASSRLLEDAWGQEVVAEIDTLTRNAQEEVSQRSADQRTYLYRRAAAGLSLVVDGDFRYPNGLADAQLAESVGITTHRDYGYVYDF